MKIFVPVNLTQPFEQGKEEPPPDLHFKDLGPLRVMDVHTDPAGSVAMELANRNTHVTLVADKTGGITVYRDDHELVEAT